MVKRFSVLNQKYEVIVDFPENLTNIKVILNGADIYITIKIL